MSNKLPAGSKFTDKVFADALVNMLTGMGTSVDKAMSDQHQISAADMRHELEAMYREDWFSAKAVDIPASDMTRAWRRWDNLDETKLKIFEATEHRFGIKHKFKQGIRYGRWYGGAGLVLNIDGTGKPEEPLDLNRVKKDSFLWCNVLHRWQLGTGTQITNDPLNPNYGKPEWYTAGNGTQIHYTRVIPFEGVELPYDIESRSDYWGDSILRRVKKTINNAISVNNSIANTLREFSLDVFKIEGLDALMTDSTAREGFMNRLAFSNLSKSVYNALLLDASEEHQKQSLSFSGVKELVFEYAAQVAAGTDIPVTRYLGVSPGGLNATGDSDLENYYTRINADQEEQLRPRQTYLDGILFRSIFGTPPPEDASFEYVPLWNLSDKEEAEVQNLKAQRDATYAGILPESSVYERIERDGVYELPEGFLDEIRELEAEQETALKGEGGFEEEDEETDEDAELEEDDTEKEEETE